VSGLKVDGGTVTFNVSWPDAGASNLWSDTVWVFVDYNKNGKMARMLISGGTLTEHSGTGEFIPENTMGAWVVGDARTNGSFSATVQLLTATADLYGACAYASSYPPVGQYVSESEIVFSGTPMYEIKLLHEDGYTVETIESGGTFLLPCSYTVSSFTDATGAPGIIKCLAPTNPTFATPLATICAGATVTLTASATGAASYSIDNATWQTSPEFKVKPDANTSYTLYAKTEEGCVGSVANAAVVTVNPLPANPSVTAAASCGTGMVTLYASSSGAVIDWYGGSSGGTVSLSGNNTYTTPSIDATRDFYAQARTTAGCLSASRTAVRATINTVPENPSVTANSRCETGTVVLYASSSGAVIDWYGSSGGGTALLRGSNTYTTTSLSSSRTFYTQARTTAGCLSTGRTAVTATVTQPSGANTAKNACGCASGLNDCNGTCLDVCWKICGASEIFLPAGGTRDWSKAISDCSALGTGWRLPTRSELKCLCSYKSSLPVSYSNYGYWSISELEKYVYFIDFASNCSEITTTKTQLKYISCIK
jgi:hypothetical protein